jgi:hypothetical protein
MNSKKPTVDLNELIDSLDIGFDSLRFFVDKKTCQIVSLSDDDDFSEEEGDDELDDDSIPEHYIPLPDRWELNKYQMLEDFCFSIEDEKIQVHLLNAIRGKGAFGRFKTAIECLNIQEDWYRYEHECMKEIAIEFCLEHELPYRYNNNPRSSDTLDFDF